MANTTKAKGEKSKAATGKGAKSATEVRKTTPAGEAVLIDLPNWQTVEFELAGTSPLLTHPFSQKAQLDMLRDQIKGGKSSRKGVAREPRLEFLNCFYVMPGCEKQHEMAATEFLANTKPDDIDGAIFNAASGAYGFPALAFRSSMIRAAADFLPDHMTDVAVRFRVETGLVPITWGEVRCRMDYVSVGSGKDLRFRPEWSNWGAKLRIRHNVDRSPVSSLVALLTQAGEAVGVGDWRLEKKKGMPGYHGAFEIVSASVVA